MTASVQSGTRVVDGPPPADGLPQWFADDRAQAWQRFTSLPMPLRTDERWRFATVKRLQLDDFHFAPEPETSARTEAADRSLGVCGTSGQMIFLNDRCIARRHAAAELAAKGVLWKPIAEALSEDREVLRRHFMAHTTDLGGQKFSALHRACASNGAFLFVPDNVEVELPLEHFYWIDGADAAAFPHTLIVAGRNSKVTVVETFASLIAGQRHFSCGVNDLYAGEGAQVVYVSIQDWSRSSLALQFNSIVADRDAQCRTLNLHLGSHYARNESVSRLIGQGASSDMLAVTHAAGEQEFDQRTLQDHQHPHTKSDLLYKNALDGVSRTIFSGLIKVEPGAHYTDAYQKVRNLMLSDEADANSMPGLEILADQVRCTHGATNGAIDAEELFYLKARGIPDKTAARLIAMGFLGEVFQRLENPAVEERLTAALNAKAGTVA